MINARKPFKSLVLMMFNTRELKRIYEQNDVYLGGPVQVFSEGDYSGRFPEFARPAKTRAIFANNGWATIAAFQTRNPLHRSHEYLTKVALEI